MPARPGHASAGIRAAYDEGVHGWLSGTERMYARLAAVMVARSPTLVAGASVLDVGAGTGVAGRAALAAGARWVVALDLSRAMLAAGRPSTTHSASFPLIADCRSLPLRAASVDLVLAGCCFGHLPDPIRGLGEARRVGAAMVATAFRAGWTHPAKAGVDEVLREHGHRPPDWYVTLKQVTEPLVDEPDSFRRLAERAGWADVEAAVVDVPTGLRSPAELAGWRLGMAHIAPWLAAMEPEARVAARLDAEAAVAGAPELVVPLVVLRAG